MSTYNLLSTGSLPENLRPGIRAFFGMAYPNFKTVYDRIFDVKMAEDRAYEEDVMMYGLGLASVKPQGADVMYDGGNQLFAIQYPHVQYGLGFQITYEAMSDGVGIKLAKAMAESLKLSMLRSREIVCANFYANIFSAPTTTTGGDGVAVCGSHPTPAGNQSNVPTTINALSEASLEQAIIDIMGYDDNRGILIGVQPAKLILPRQLQFTAQRILASQMRSATANNDINAIKDMGMLSTADIVINPYFSSSTNWFVRTDQPGMNFFNRRDITLSDDNVFDSENMKFKGLMRFSLGATDFRSIYGVNA